MKVGETIWSTTCDKLQKILHEIQHNETQSKVKYIKQLFIGSLTFALFFTLSNKRKHYME